MRISAGYVVSVIPHVATPRACAPTPSPTSPCQGLEIIEQVPDVEAVVVPVGGGGLIAGVALAVKTLKPDVIVIVSDVTCLGVGDPRCTIGTVLVQCFGVWHHNVRAHVDACGSSCGQGAEPLSVPSMTEAFKAGKPVMVDAGATLADGLLVPMVGANAFEISRKFVDKCVGVPRLRSCWDSCCWLLPPKSTSEGALIV